MSSPALNELATSQMDLAEAGRVAMVTIARHGPASAAALAACEALCVAGALTLRELTAAEDGDIRGEPHQIVMSGDATSVQVLRTVLALLAPKADPSDADDAPEQGSRATAASSSGVDGTTTTHGGASAPAPGTASVTPSNGADDPASGQQAAAAATAADGPVDTADPSALQAALRRMARREALQRHPDLPAAATAVAWTLASILDEDAGWAAINFYFSHALVSAQNRLKDWLVYVVASASPPHVALKR